MVLKLKLELSNRRCATDLPNWNFCLKEFTTRKLGSFVFLKKIFH